jgi:hypothetical protein
MLVIAHAAHWALSVLEILPLIAVMAFMLWKLYADRSASRGRQPASPLPGAQP